jgi:hypothetical protein
VRVRWQPVFLVLFAGAATARGWLARAEREEREARLRAAQAASDEIQRKLTSDMLERSRAEQNEALRREVEALKAQGDRIEVPKLAPMASARPLGSADVAAQKEEASRALADWETTPHSMYVTWADLALAPVEQARPDEVRSSAARKALVARLAGVKGRLAVALGGRERFADAAAVRAELAEVDAAIAAIPEALSRGPHVDMARENAAQLRRMLAAVPDSK